MPRHSGIVEWTAPEANGSPRVRLLKPPPTLHSSSTGLDMASATNACTELVPRLCPALTGTDVGAPTTIRCSDQSTSVTA